MPNQGIENESLTSIQDFSMVSIMRMKYLLLNESKVLFTFYDICSCSLKEVRLKKASLKKKEKRLSNSIKGKSQ
jgi:hypothetical protein